mgnify:CR=1 FL=1
MIPIAITGTGSCIPQRVLTNDDLSKIVETSDEWISTRTGIKERHVVTGEATSDWPQPLPRMRFRLPEFGRKK